MSALRIGWLGCPLSPLQPMRRPGRGAAKPPTGCGPCAGGRHCRSPRTGICSLIDLNKELVSGSPGAAHTHAHTPHCTHTQHTHTYTHIHTHAQTPATLGPAALRALRFPCGNPICRGAPPIAGSPLSCPPFNSHDIFISLLSFSRRIWRLRWVVGLLFFFFPSLFPSPPPPPPSPPSLQEMMANRDLK